MGKIVFVKYDTKEDASIFAAHLITTMFGLLPASKTKVLGTATGQTPVLTYQKIAEIVSRPGHIWPKIAETIEFWQLDTYVSPGATKDNLPLYSYERELKSSIWRVPNGGCYIPYEWAEDPEKEAERYGYTVAGRIKRAWYTFQLLGIGDEDGHIAFNMPGDSFKSKTHVVKLNKETRVANGNKFFDGDEEKVPKYAITTGIGEILESDAILLEAFGRKKADIVWKSFFDDPTNNIPATALQLFKGNLVVLLDEEAASTIVEKEGEDVFKSCALYEPAIEDFCFKYMFN